jgi:hypothetical protein
MPDWPGQTGPMLPNRPVPDPLRDALARWGDQGRPEQSGVAWPLGGWQRTLPAYAQFFASLPNPIARPDVAARAEDADRSPDAATESFLAAMVWGYGRVGYGPFRTAQVLAVNPQVAPTLLEVARRTKRDGGPAGFEYLSRNRLHGLGVAFATKYLYYCSVGSTATPALVLDRLVRNWLADNAGWRISLDWRVQAYDQYVRTAASWARELGLQPAEVEYLMFSDQVSTDSLSQWAPATPGGGIASPPPAADEQPGHTAGVSAVLEALADAADAFAALPDEADPHAADDFERGLRQLRRIVLVMGSSGPDRS